MSPFVNVLDLPPQPEIDRSRAGVLTITPIMLTSLLRLPKGQEVADVGVNFVGDLLLTIEGAGMPVREPTRELKQITIWLHVDVRGEGAALEQRITAWWEHDPTNTWIMSDWTRHPSL